MFKQQTYPSKERKKMMPIKFSCLLLVFLLTVWHSIAYPHLQDKTAAIEHNAILTRKEAMVDGILSATDAREKRLKGRKMVVDNIVVTKPKKVNNKSGANIGGTNSKCELIEGKEGSNIKYCEQSVESLLPKEVAEAEAEAEAGFVAFSADYHSPQLHPPKNN